jgi:hypothetical protein
MCAKAVIQKKKREKDLARKDIGNWERQHLIANLRLVYMTCLKCKHYEKPSSDAIRSIVYPLKNRIGHKFFTESDNFLDEKSVEHEQAKRKRIQV